MLEKKESKKAEKLIGQFFKKLTFKIDFRIESQTEDSLIVSLTTEEPQILIGERGKTLFEIQMLLSKMLRKQLGRQFYIDIDINEYKLNKIKHLKDLAKEIADSVALSSASKELFPMSPYERRVIHMELADRGDVKTESLGEGEERRIIIRPA